MSDIPALNHSTTDWVVPARNSQAVQGNPALMMYGIENLMRILLPSVAGGMHVASSDQVRERGMPNPCSAIRLRCTSLVPP